MTLSVTVHQASLNALAAWLTTNLIGSPSVDPRWPDPDKILSGGGTAGGRYNGPVAVTLIPVGKPSDEYLDTVTNPVVTTGIRLRRQPVRLDIWAAYDVDRDDIIAQLDTLLAGRGGPATDATTAAQLGIVDHGVVLSLADGYAPRVAGFKFDAPTVVDNEDSVSRVKYRGTYAGEATMVVEIP